jgi:hypothetical protein
MWLDPNWIWTLTDLVSRADNAYWKCRCSMTDNTMWRRRELITEFYGSLDTAGTEQFSESTSIDLLCQRWLTISQPP